MLFSQGSVDASISIGFNMTLLQYSHRCFITIERTQSFRLQSPSICFCPFYGQYSQSVDHCDIILFHNFSFWVNIYSAGLTKALHSINCLATCPSWWSKNRLWAVSSAAIAFMSSASSSKSKRFRFSFIRSLWTVFGMMITSLCNSHRNATCAAVVLC